jgi:hypothetical protein
MVTEKIEFKRVGPPKAIESTQYAFLTVQITLDGEPNSDWIECFKHPSSYIPDESHPSKASIMGDCITFTSFRTNVRTNVIWMDKYIHQANECYKTLVAIHKAEKESQIAKEQAEKEELDRINESLKDL